MLAVLGFAGCASRQNGQSISLNQKVYHNHPIAVRVHSKYIDEDTPMEYTLRFRNVGREVLSFDYTLSDQPNVPHIDRDGPNSGLVSNLYPGAVIEVANPLKKKRLWVTLGKVTSGKKAPAELDVVYPHTGIAAAEPAQLPALQ